VQDSNIQKSKQDILSLVGKTVKMKDDSACNDYYKAEILQFYGLKKRDPNFKHLIKQTT
jgi:hypothetical protein